MPQQYMCDNCGKPVITKDDYAGTVAMSITTGAVEPNPMQEMFEMMGRKTPATAPKLDSAICCTIKCAISLLMIKELEMGVSSIDDILPPDNRLQYLP